MGKRVVFSLVLVATLASCGPSERTAMVQQREVQLKAFKPVSYSRLADGVEERITIAADGSVTRTRTGPAMDGKLSEFQIMQLKRLFDDWNALNSSYPAAGVATGGDRTTIKYAEKSVSVSDTAKDVPETFVLVRQKIEQYVRDLGRSAAPEGGAQ